MTARKTGGKEAVASAVKQARPVKAKTADATASHQTPDFLKKRFIRKNGWIFRVGDGESGDTPICAEFEIAAESRDVEGKSWGLLVKWRDRRGNYHEEVFPRSLFSGDCAEIRSRLADGGLTFSGSTAARQGFAEYLNIASSDKTILTVTRPGWHGPTFVTPNFVFGGCEEIVKLLGSDRETHTFNSKGTLGSWQENLSKFCIGNSRLIFATCCAFGAPMLRVLGEQGGGFNLCGQARTGKTTALMIAASVWGGTEQNGARGYIRTCRATGNGLEAVALAHCDCLLVLDELGEINADEAGAIAYMLANGQTKVRANRYGGTAKERDQFREIFLTSGEIGFEEKNREAGRETRAGQEVRWVKVPSDAGGKYGLFDHLHEAETATAFVDHLDGAAAENFGTAAPAFLTRLTSELQSDPGFAHGLRKRTTALLDTWLKPFGEAGGQVRSIGFRFALVAIAGETASEWLVTGWAPGEAAWGVGLCFKAALQERGTLGAREAEQAVTKLRGYLLTQGASRFARWIDKRRDDAAQTEIEDDQPPDGARVVIQIRSGWKRWTRLSNGKSCWTYFMTFEGMSEALRGLNYREAVAALAERNYIVRSPDGRIAHSMTPPGESKTRLYQIDGSIFETDGTGLDQRMAKEEIVPSEIPGAGEWLANDQFPNEGA